MREFKIKDGIIIKLDDDVYDVVSKYKWRVVKPFLHESKIVFETYMKDKNGHSTHIRLHRLIMGNPPKGITVMFRENDRLNLQKSNLYLVRNYATLLRKSQKKFHK